MTTKRELWNMLYNERKEHERTLKELEKTKRLLRKYKKMAGRVQRTRSCYFGGEPDLIYPG